MRTRQGGRRLALAALAATVTVFQTMAGGADMWPDRMPRFADGREFYVAPDGRADAAGSKDAPLDIVTIFTRADLLKPGDVVWIRGGRYAVPELVLNPAINGTKERPIIFRAVSGERATLLAEIRLQSAYVWFWGLEITGEHLHGVSFDKERASDGVKLINLVIHDLVVPGKEHLYGIAGWITGNDQEYYGNLLYNVGTTGADHGTYSQNTAEFTTKHIDDNFIFNNAGYGMHVWGVQPFLANLHLEGNICFGTRRGCNFLAGGEKPTSNLVVKDNCTYQAPDRRGTYGVNVGYTAQGSHDLIIEGNYFMGGVAGMVVRGISHNVTVRGNTVWGYGDLVNVSFAPDATRANLLWDDNTYVDNHGFDLPAWVRANGLTPGADLVQGKPFDFAAWQQATSFDAHSRLAAGKNGHPAGLHVIKRINKYEPSRVHLAVYNWDHAPTVKINVADICPPGTKYRIVNVEDFFGAAVADGVVTGESIVLPMGGHEYEPEFGGYVLFLLGETKP